eukprot:gene10256-12580_t
MICSYYNRSIKKSSSLENINELPKFLIVEILKHLNDKYSCCNTPIKGSIFTNNCYSDLLVNGKDELNNSTASSSSDQDDDDSNGNNSSNLNNSSNNVNNKENSSSNSSQNKNCNDSNISKINTAISTCTYLKDLVNLSLVCKMWCKYIVPLSISSIKLVHRRELATIRKYMTEGIVEGGTPCIISTLKFHYKLPNSSGGNNGLSSSNSSLPIPCSSSSSSSSSNSAITPITSPFSSRELKALLQGSNSLKSIIFDSHQLTMSDIAVLSDYLKSGSAACNLSDLKVPNNFCTPGFLLFADCLRTNESIVALDISSNFLTRESIIALSEALKHNHTITTLDLSFNSIGTNGIYLADMIKLNTTIQSIYLMGNQLNNDSVIAIAEALRTKNSTITEISLSENDFCDEIGSVIGDLFQSNKSIKTLDLSFNDLSETTAIGFSEAFLHNDCSLETINLSDCDLGSHGGAVPFFRALQSNTTVQQLILWSCELSDPKVKEELALALRHNHTLTSVSLGFNSFTSDDICVLVHKGLKFNKTISSISFSNNYITSIGGVTVAELLRHNTTIKELSLFDNRLDNTAAIEFLISLAKNHTIQKLCLGSNRICPNISSLFRKILTWNQPMDRPEIKQQWINRKIQFMASEIYKLEGLRLKLNYQNSLGNSLRELFKLIGLNTNNLLFSPQSTLSASSALQSPSSPPNNNIYQHQQQQQQQQQQTSIVSGTPTIPILNLPVSPITAGGIDHINLNILNLNNSSKSLNNPLSEKEQHPQQQQQTILSPSIIKSPCTSQLPPSFFSSPQQQPPQLQQQTSPVTPTIFSPTFQYSKQPASANDLQDQLLQLQAQLQLDLHNYGKPCTGFF